MTAAVEPNPAAARPGLTGGDSGRPPSQWGQRHGTTSLRVGAASIWLSVIVLLPLAAIIMAGANVTGSFLGTHLALRHGSGFVRRLFLCVVCALIVKFAWDTFR